MSFELAPGTLLNNRYQIKKVITFSNDGGVYLARDLKVTDKNWIVKELIPAAELDEETLAARRALFSEAVESAMQFDQPSLPRILDQFTEARREYVVMEYIDGVTLQFLCDSSVNPLPEKEILGWAMQICDALIYLHNRPKPFIFGALSPGHVVLTSDQKVKLINYGLDRFFMLDGPPKVFADNPKDVQKEFVHFGETLAYLLTKEQPGPLGLQSPNVSADTTRVVNHMLAGETQKAYESFDGVRKDLDLALNPPAQPKKEATPPPSSKTRKTVVMPGEAGEPPAFVKLLSNAALAVLSQRIAWLAAEVAAVVIICVVAYWYTHPGINYRKNGATAYIGVGSHELVALQIGDRKIVDRQTLLGTIGDLAVAGTWLYVSDANTNRILRIDTENDQPPEQRATIQVDTNPTRMVVDEQGRYLFVAHDATHNVSRVNLTRDPPQMDKILAVGNVPHELAVSPKGDELYVANAKDSNVSFIEPDTSKNKGNVSVGGMPWGMALAPEGSGLNQLWVTVQSPDAIAIIDVNTREVKQTITDLMNGKKPTSAVFSVDGSKVFVTMEASNSVVVFDTAKMAASKSISVGEAPRRIVFTPALNQLWVVGKSGITIIDPSSDAVSGQIPLNGASGAATMAK